ncbi:MAG: hypothetical protein SFY96_10435 [Planctomycetota bacterium]|nr:hypothetical protein [Planctomycetota bacterium]
MIAVLSIGMVLAVPQSQPAGGAGGLVQGQERMIAFGAIESGTGALCDAFGHHTESSAVAVVAGSEADPIPASAREREVFIPSPGSIALLGVGLLAMRRRRGSGA